MKQPANGSASGGPSILGSGAGILGIAARVVVYAVHAADSAACQAANAALITEAY